MKKILYALPYLIIPVFTPIYNILDRKFFVEIFGCGCVPIAQTNMLNIGYNANDLRMTIFSVLTLILTAWGYRLSRRFGNYSDRIVYCVSIFVINVILTVCIYQKFMWA
ncbi:MAG: hypothetical protein IJZ84_02900 [Lachnospiraceae bacterium]|nr:hypothetical protein [Lachnospiraceae bacterium]